MNKKLLFTFFVSSTAIAHRPYFAEGNYTSSEGAFYVEDPDISMVLYGELTCEEEQLWLTFETVPDFDLYVQLGVPEIGWLEEFRPSMALLHPDLPEAEEDLPFDVPEGFGVQVWHSEPSDAAEDFYEPFTQTRSWIWQEETVPLESGGTGYVVAWNPSGWTAKVWLAVGTIEDFSGVDWSEFGTWGAKVNDFHETAEETGESLYCEPEETPVEETAPLEDEGGCSASGLGGSKQIPALLLAAGAMLLRRRQQQ
ncbi:MAG: MYXO-CTERM sorting domain-containing protein [Myxococcota bacterium]|nr:MYXO-CTERM sorting domain-containing protein [Myxococcota bacterium]